MSVTNDLDEVGSVARGALRGEVTRRLLINIFEGKLPPGSRLVVQKLAARFGISTTPVRESLVGLEAAGMVRFLHNRGVIVRAFGREQLREICQVRRILETEATRSACGRIGPGALQEFRRETLALNEPPHDAAWSERALAVDMAVHRAISRACGNVRLAEEISRYDTLVNAMAEAVGNRRDIQTRGLREHVLILDKLLAKDAEGAADEIARHINNTARDLEAIMFPENA